MTFFKSNKMHFLRPHNNDNNYTSMGRFINTFCGFNLYFINALTFSISKIIFYSIYTVYCYNHYDCVAGSRQRKCELILI